MCTYWARILSQKLGLFLIRTEADRVLLSECSRINLSLALWILFSAVWAQQSTKCFLTNIFVGLKIFLLRWELRPRTVVVLDNYWELKSNNWKSLCKILISQWELSPSLSLSQLRNWYLTIKEGRISFIGNICLTGNILGSDLLRLIPRWRGGRLLVVFLSFRTSILFRFWSTCKAFSKAKTSIKGFRPKQAPINSGKNEWQKI